MELAAHIEVYHNRDLAEMRKIAMEYYGSDDAENMCIEPRSTALPRSIQISIIIL